MNPYDWTSQLVQLNVRSRLRLLAVANCVLANKINWNGEIHLKQFDFEVQDKDKKGSLCTLSKLAILSTSTIHQAGGEDEEEPDPPQVSKPKKPKTTAAAEPTELKRTLSLPDPGTAVGSMSRRKMFAA